jgi:hypothetical protein
MYRGLLSKGGVTQLIRERGSEEGWERTLGAHLDRVRPDSSHPSSLIVFTFELSLQREHTPEQFVEKVLPIIGATAPVIDEIMIEPVGASRRSII